MIIFNAIALLELIVALVPGLIAFGLIQCLGFNPGPGFVITTLGCGAALDLLIRAAGMFGNDGEDGEEVTEGAGILNLLWPNGGGHVFFFPVWLIAGAGFALTSLAGISILLGA